MQSTDRVIGQRSQYFNERRVHLFGSSLKEATTTSQEQRVSCEHGTGFSVVSSHVVTNMSARVAGREQAIDLQTANLYNENFIIIMRTLIMLIYASFKSTNL